jgi:hypothetical protein
LLSSENTANGVSLVELRHAYPATAPWSAQFVMEPASGTSTQRNASVVFGDGPATNALIVAGLQPGTRTLRITESQTGRVATAPYLGSITGPLSCRVAFGVEPASMTLTVGNSSVSLELEGTYASFNHVGYSVSRSSGRFGVVRPVGASPCIADFNGDGGVDSADVEAFFMAWEAGESIADVNADGGVNGDDVGTFFAAWESGGCP